MGKSDTVNWPAWVGVSPSTNQETASELDQPATALTISEDIMRDCLWTRDIYGSMNSPPEEYTSTSVTSNIRSKPGQKATGQYSMPVPRMKEQVDSPSCETNIEYELPATKISSEGDTAAFQRNDMPASKTTLTDEMPNLERSSLTDSQSFDTHTQHDTPASESSTQTTGQAPKVESARYPQWIENHVTLGRETKYPDRFSAMSFVLATEDGVVSFEVAFECEGRLVEE